MTTLEKHTMTGLDTLYDYAVQKKILVYFARIGIAPAVTIKDLENFNIALDSSHIYGENEEKIILMHELAHIAVGAFYKNSDSITYKKRMENKASRWLIRLLIPADKLDGAVNYGITETWELAEYFEVPEDFMAKAIEYYKISA